MTEGNHKHAVLNVTTGKMYDSVKAAADDYGVRYNQIIRAAHEGRLCRKCLWKYADADLVIKERPKYDWNVKAVIDLNTKARWDSINDACKMLGLTRSQVQIAMGKHRPVKGFKLVLEEDYKKYGDKLLEQFNGKEELGFCREVREIICLETGQRFKTVAGAAKKLGLTRQVVDIAVKQGRSAGGYHFYYADVDPDAIRFTDPNSRKPCLAVMDLNSNRMWGSIAECAKDLGLTRGTAYRYLRLGLMMKDGTHLVYFRDWIK